MGPALISVLIDWLNIDVAVLWGFFFWENHSWTQSTAEHLHTQKSRHKVTITQGAATTQQAIFTLTWINKRDPAPGIQKRTTVTTVWQPQQQFSVLCEKKNSLAFSKCSNKWKPTITKVIIAKVQYDGLKVMVWTSSGHVHGLDNSLKEM